MDAMEARAGRHSDDSPGIGRAKAEEKILAPLRKIARLMAEAIGKPEAVSKIRFTEERALRRELGFYMDNAQRWPNFPRSRLDEASNAVERRLAAVERIPGIAGATSTPEVPRRPKLGATTQPLPFFDGLVHDGDAANDGERKAN
jgi:hypothetical protein